MRDLLLLCLAASAGGAIADPTDAYRLPQGSWLTVGNDSWFTSHDDMLTAEVAAHLARPTWSATIDDQMLTDQAHMQRADQAGIVAGPRQFYGRIEIELGAGVAIDGNLGGEQVQNGMHHVIDRRPVLGAYRSTLRASPLVVGAARATWSWIEPQVIVCAHRHFAAVEPSLAVGSERMRLQLGWNLSWGADLSPTAYEVDDFLRGPTASLGFHLGAPAFALTASGRALLWSVGLTF